MTAASVVFVIFPILKVYSEDETLIVNTELTIFIVVASPLLNVVEKVSSTFGVSDPLTIPLVAASTLQKPPKLLTTNAKVNTIDVKNRLNLNVHIKMPPFVIYFSMCS